MIDLIGVRGTGLPTYLQSAYGGYLGLLPRRLEFRLLRQFYVSIPMMSKAVEILAGLVGCPQIIVGGDPESPGSQTLKTWAQDVAYGYVGQGLKAWLADHIGQALTYGYGIGESVSSRDRASVQRLWSYASPSFGFRTGTSGEIICVQNQPGKGLVSLDPLNAILTVYRPEGCDPNGQPLFFASGTACQVWLDTIYSYREAVRRAGIPTFHIHTQIPVEAMINDPEGTLSDEITAATEAAWNEGVRSQVEDGIAKDFFTANVGDTKVVTIGGDGTIPDINQHKQAIAEEIVTATGIPPFMFGLTWATTERMSTQQADVLISVIDTLRELVSPAIRKILDLHNRLAADRTLLDYELKWCDVTLQDLTETAQAAYWDAQSQQIRQKVYRQLWTDGVVDQSGYAEEVTGDDTVVTSQDEPPAAAVPAALVPSSSGNTGAGGSPPGDGGTPPVSGGAGGRSRSLSDVRRALISGDILTAKAMLDVELADTYPEFPTHAHNGNGREH